MVHIGTRFLYTSVKVPECCVPVCTAATSPVYLQYYPRLRSPHTTQGDVRLLPGEQTASQDAQ